MKAIEHIGKGKYQYRRISSDKAPKWEKKVGNIWMLVTQYSEYTTLESQFQTKHYSDWI